MPLHYGYNLLYYVIFTCIFTSHGLRRHFTRRRDVRAVPEASDLPDAAPCGDPVRVSCVRAAVHGTGSVTLVPGT